MEATPIVLSAEVHNLLSRTPLECLGPVFDLLAERCYQTRLSNKGRVQREIFEATQGIGGACPCYQVIVEVLDPLSDEVVGYALRKRDASETGDEWAGMYHNVCTVGRMTEDPKDIFQRIFSDMNPRLLDVSKLERLGTTIHSEKERRSDAHTNIWKIQVDAADVDLFFGEWKVFKLNELEDPSIIDHMQAILKWAADPGSLDLARVMTKY